MTRAISPALLKRRLGQSDVLIRLAELRRDVAVQALAGARRLFAEAVDAHEAAVIAARALAEDQAARREVLRNPMLGSAQLRGALDGVLNTFVADREREAEAERAIVAAGQAVEAARQRVSEARQLVARAERMIDKRRRMREPLAEARLRALDRGDELEAEERRLNAGLNSGLNAGRGAGAGMAA